MLFVPVLLFSCTVMYVLIVVVLCQLIDCYGNIKLTDFGLMKPGMSRKARTEKSMATAMSTRGLGSVSYMSPEMKGATNYNPNEFTDVWSCAVAFCLMFAADLPPEDWALQQKRDPEFYKRWLTGHDLNPSPAFYEMFDQMFRVKFPSSREHMQVRMLWSTGRWLVEYVDVLLTNCFFLCCVLYNSRCCRILVVFLPHDNTGRG